MPMSWQAILLTFVFRVQHAFSSWGKKIDLKKERSELEKLGSTFKPLARMEHENISAFNVPAEWITGTDAQKGKVVLYLHGGSYISGSISSYRSLAANIANAAQARALIIDYRLAPEHPFPAALEDAAGAYRWLMADQIHPLQIFLAGDSSGGGLVLALLQKLRDSGEPLPAAAVCMSPMTDHTFSGETWKTNARADVVIYPYKEREFSMMYLGGADPRDPLVSPHFADLSGLPPLLIQVGTNEVLLSDCRRLAEKARSAGVSVTLEEWEGMQHVWQFAASFLPEGRRAIERIGEFLRAHMST